MDIIEIRSGDRFVVQNGSGETITFNKMVYDPLDRLLKLQFTLYDNKGVEVETKSWLPFDIQNALRTDGKSWVLLTKKES